MAALICTREMHAKIDSCSKTLRRQQKDLRGDALKAAIAAGEQYISNTKRLLLRAAMVRGNLVQYPKPAAADSSPADRPRRPEHRSTDQRRLAFQDDQVHFPSGPLPWDESENAMTPPG